MAWNSPTRTLNSCLLTILHVALPQSSTAWPIWWLGSLPIQAASLILKLVLEFWVQMLTLPVLLSFVISFTNFCGPISANCNYKQYAGPYNSTVYNANVKYALAQLRAIEPHLYGCNATFCSYPTTQDDVDLLFGNGSLCIVSSYSPLHPGRMVHSGAWPATTSLFLPTNPGTIGNTNFVGIAYNAKNLFGALVVANEIASYAAQFSRRDPNGWGAGETYDPSSPELVETGWDEGFSFIDAQSYPPSASKAQLQSVAVPELDSAYQTEFQIEWQNCIALGSNSPPCM